MIEQEETVDLDRLMNDYGDAILRMCVLYLKDMHLAEDVVQETFIKVYHQYHTFKQQSEEKTWIMRIAINTCKNHRRTSWFSKVNPVEEEAILETASHENIEIDLVEAEGSKQLLKQIMSLKEKYKEVILLYYYQEMSTKEIAETLGIKESTVRVRMQRGREQLGVKLKEMKANG